MKTIYLILFLLFAIPSFGQSIFDSAKVSKDILQCARNINIITTKSNFASIDSFWEQYCDEIWMKMPYANVSELYELTNYPNKYVRLQAFDLLVQFKDQVDTSLIILMKNIGDTLEFTEQLIGCILYRRNIFEHMFKTAEEWWKLKLSKNPEFLSKEQQEKLKYLKNYLKKNGA